MIKQINYDCRISVSFPKELDKKLKDRAKQEMRPVSSLVRQAVSEWLNKPDIIWEKGGESR